MAAIIAMRADACGVIRKAPEAQTATGAEKVSPAHAVGDTSRSAAFLILSIQQSAVSFQL
jgi:hypothetical protein